MPDLTYISKGNNKLGDRVFSFNIPAKLTCPGMTKTCGEKCYAYNYMRAYTNVDKKYKRNLAFANGDEFVMHMIEEIPDCCEFRIHVSGDFYSPEYVYRWIEIAANRPDVTFYTYTRSWLIPDIWDVIVTLAALANVNVNLSVDQDTGKPHLDSYRWCYLTDDDTAPEWMRMGDIIFRSNHGGQKKKRRNDVAKGIDPDIRAPLIHKISDATVCPLERGKEMPKSFSCSRCHLCVEKPQIPQHVHN